MHHFKLSKHRKNENAQSQFIVWARSQTQSNWRSWDTKYICCFNTACNDNNHFLTAVRYTVARGLSPSDTNKLIKLLFMSVTHHIFVTNCSELFQVKAKLQRNAQQHSYYKKRAPRLSQSQVSGTHVIIALYSFKRQSFQIICKCRDFIFFVIISG